MNLQGISSCDGRQIEVAANGLPLWGGAQLAVDATLVSPVGRDGHPHLGASEVDGLQLQEARRRKETKYHELVRSRRCRLVVLALEVGGRWSEDALDFVRLWPSPQPGPTPVSCASRPNWLGLLSGWASCPWLPTAPWHAPSSSSLFSMSGLMGRTPSWKTSSTKQGLRSLRSPAAYPHILAKPRYVAPSASPCLHALAW